MRDTTRAPFAIREGVIEVQPPDEIWVRTGDGVAAIADKIVQALNMLPYVDVAAIGAGAVNQAAKAIAVARERMSHQGRDIWSQIYFSTIDWRDAEDPERTRMVLRCVPGEISALPVEEAM